ncbi:transglycosylase SLT domain-containing protein [Luteibacter sp. 3190]|uniref:lytic transglycosylase domain-containing protein n=1 Tax=Luteibacter sp. 3190 TaxID=2817736 RepID=UPI00286A107F|nr:transglycosylase SLT domain-containing protein [Luteibacter sp. 3190]
MEMMGCQNLAVPAEVMQHVVNVESSRNPFAIGVVGGRLVRQPTNIGEAVATVRMLEQRGYNYSLGIAQVNRSNLGKFGLDTFEKAFEYCPNVTAGSRILAQCYESAGRNWGKAFSCYYSGNFTTGYEHGYVQRIYDSMTRSGMVSTASPIPLERPRGPVKVVAKGTDVNGLKTDTPDYRIAMRRVLDAAASAVIAPAMASEQTPVIPPGNATMPVADAPASAGAPRPIGRIATDAATAAAMSQVGPRIPQATTPPPPGRIATDAGTAAVMSQIGISSNATGSAPAAPEGDASIFVPQVRAPGETPAPSNRAPARQAAPARDPADLRTGGHDDAFVF